MSFRRTGKLLTLVGFVICLSLLGILYGNLNTVTEERDHILSKKNEIKQEIEEHQSKISSLEAKVSRLENSLNSCNAAKLETEERNSLLQNDEGSLKVEVEQQRSALENLRSSKDRDIEQLRGQISDLQSDQSGREEAADACSTSNDVLQQQMNAAMHRISVKEGELTVCIKEKRSLQSSLQSGETREEAAPEKDDSNGIINPVAAVPAPDKGEVKSGDHVADIPDIPQNNAVIDNKQEIPGAQAPAPLPVVEQPVIPGDMGQANAAPPKQETKRDVDPDEVGELSVEIVPLQPVPDNILAESLDKVREEMEQLKVLQERQDMFQGQLPQIPLNLEPEGAGDEAAGEDVNLVIQPALPPEILPVLPAPDNVER